MTWRTSLVLWYSIVAFQWRSVWNVICCSLGLPNLWAKRLRCRVYVLRRWLSLLDPNKVEWSLGSRFIMLMRRLPSLKIRGLLCFSGVTLIVELTRSRSVHLSWCASPARIPVSLSSRRNVEGLGVVPASPLRLEHCSGRWQQFVLKRFPIALTVCFLSLYFPQQ